MRLTIDIPEQMYLNAKTGILCGNDILVKAIKNGMPHENVTEFADRCRECGREKVLDKIRAEIEALTKTYPFINHIDAYVKEDDVKKIIDKYDKYNAESEDKCKKCEYYINPDYTRCHECKSESEVQDAHSR